MPLTPEEQAQYDALKAKEAEPEKSGRGENVSVIVDLADPDAVRRAKKLGYLPADFEDGDDPDPDADPDADADDPDADDPKDDKKDPSPKRRLTGADRLMGSRNE